MCREAWIGQHCIERLVNLAWSIFASFARALRSGVKRRDHDKTFARQRREKSGIGKRATPRLERSPSAM
jgi:fructose-bisphosphate aldolase class 1